MNKIILEVSGVNQWFGDQRVLHDINLKIVQGQFVALVGASGCGKSTLFNAILGTCPPKEGSVVINGEKVTGPNRNVGVVYQKYGLYRFLTATENVAFGPMLDETSQFERTFMPWKWRVLRKTHLQSARDLLTKVKLGHAHDKYPSEMSGGMQQRVAICQSLIMKPHVLLLDEPFGALDESTRESLQKMLLHLYAENIAAIRNGQDPPWTVIFITHELNEAFYVSDRVVGLSRNWYEEAGFPNGKRFGASYGATKVWDRHSPTYTPDAPKDFQLFHEAKQLLKSAVLEDMRVPIERNQYVSFWEDLAKGVGSGVAIEPRKQQATVNYTEERP